MQRRQAYGHTTQRNRGRRAGGEEVISLNNVITGQSGLVGYWKMQEESDSVAFDSGPNGVSYPGAEQVANGDLINWTGSIPDGFLVTGISSPNAEITQVDSGQLNGGTNVTGGSANIFADGIGTQPRLIQSNVFTVGIPQRITIVISAITGTLNVLDAAGGFQETITTVGTHRFYDVPTNAQFQARPSGAPNCNATIDSISVDTSNPFDLQNIGMTIAQSGAGNIPFVYSGDGTTSRLELLVITDFDTAFDPANGAMVFSFLADTWTAGIDVLWHCGVDATNFIEIRRDGANLIVEYQEGGNQSIATLDTSALPGGSPTGLVTGGCSWDVAGVGLRGLFGGAQFDTDKAIASAIVGALDVDLFALFAANNSGANSWLGDGAQAAFYNETPPDSFFDDYNTATGL